MHLVEMRSIGASGRLNNVRGRRNFTSDSLGGSGALGCRSCCRDSSTRRAAPTIGFCGERISALDWKSCSGVCPPRSSSNTRRQVEPASSLKIGTRLSGGVVTAIGLERAPANRDGCQTPRGDGRTRSSSSRRRREVDRLALAIAARPCALRRLQRAADHD
jgi:hypothetical protein